ncbi:MAG: polysaccharide biosynthesis/export family protein [Bryobacteraceae bacterium]
MIQRVILWSLLLPVAAHVATAQQEPAPKSPPATEVYRLAPGDAIEIRFFYNQELNEDTSIRPDGRISLPLAGDIAVAGLTVPELIARLQELYKDTLKRPAVAVEVTNYAERKFFVGGEVERPGVFPLVGRQTVLGAILEAGGMTRSAKKRFVYLVRRGADGEAERIQISLDGLPRKVSQASLSYLQPYDVVLVAESGISKANRVMDQYVRQMLPILLTGGFDYIINAGVFNPR